MKQRGYLETSVVNYLTARQSSNLIVASHQLSTRQRWESHRSAFELFISEAVIEEAVGRATVTLTKLAADPAVPAQR